MNLKAALLACAALGTLISCSDSEISSPGEGAFIGTTPGGGTGGGTGVATGTDYTFGGCPTGTSAQPFPTATSVDTACEIAVDAGGAITTDVTLTASASEPRVYFLSQPTFVGIDDGPTPGALGGTTVDLTIQPGAQIALNNPTDFFTVNRGSRLIANGTAVAPVVFTSDVDIRDDGKANDSQGAARGQWGGLVINGRAPINSCADPSVPATCETSGEGGTGNYGGDNPADDSGTLNYVRVQYAGFEITTDNELNGIAFQGVGNGTNIDYVQVHANDDDGIEFFGGTVDASHVVITGVDDDAIDWVAGWNGTIQYALIVGTGVGDNGFEGDSNSSNNNIQPRSNPIISNWTAVGGATEDLGMQIRVGTAGLFVNGVVTSWDDGCLDVDDAATAALIESAPADVTADGVNDEDLQIDATFFSCATAIDDVTDGESLASFGNGVTNGIFTGASSLVAGGGSTTPILNGASENGVTPVDPQSLDSSLDAVTQIGAVGTAGDNWFAGWTKPGSF